MIRSIDPTVAGLIVAGLLLASAYAWVVAASQDFYFVDAPPGSVFSPADEGLQVLYNYLDELDQDVQTLQQFEDLPKPQDATIVVASTQPFVKPPTRAEGRRLADWVDQGGRLVLVGVPAGDVLQGTRIGAGQAYSTQEVSEVSPRQPSVYFQGATTIEVGNGRLLANGSEWVAHLKDTGGQVMVSRAYGAGQIVWLADLMPLQNAGIERVDNARFATLLASTSPGGVWFDEYHHGYARGGGVWDRLGSGGRTALVLALLACALYLVAQGRRLAPAIREPETKKVRTGAYIASLAELYRGAGAHREVLQTMVEGLSQSLVRRYGSVETGRERHAVAGAALDEAASLMSADKIRRDRFVTVSRAIARARQEVEGRDV